MEEKIPKMEKIPKIKTDHAKFHPLICNDIVQKLMDLFWQERDVSALKNIAFVNRTTWKIAQQYKEKYYKNHWTLIHYIGNTPNKFVINHFKQNIVKLFMRLHIFDIEIERFIGLPQFPDGVVTWEKCLWICVPDCTIGGNFRIFRAEIDSMDIVREWIWKYMMIHPRSTNVEIMLDKFHDELIWQQGIRENYWKYYHKYHKYDSQLTQNHDCDLLTLNLNKIKEIYILICKL